MAVVSGVLAPPVGRLTERVHPRYLAGIGLACFPAALVWLSLVMRPSVAVWELMLPLALLGVANGFMWGPIGTTATANLPRHQAGAGSGIYNTTRQVGGVLGSAAIAALMQSRLAAELPGTAGAGSPESSTGTLPSALHDGFSTAMAESVLLPAAVLAVGLFAVLLFARPAYVRPRARASVPASSNADVPG
jgi:MFS family permease